MKNIIFGFSGSELTNEEREFFSKEQPAGFIIFSRNIRSKNQLKDLCAELKKILTHKSPLILIDQEGGKVQRLKSPLSKNYPPQYCFYEKFKEFGAIIANQSIYENFFELASELKECGITNNCSPVADILYETAHDVIGDRSFGPNVELIIEFCKTAISAHKDAGIEPIIKHIPGHGLAKCDSHLELPVVDEDLDFLEKSDFKVFKELVDFSDFAMSAHILFKCLDKINPASCSKIITNYIRSEIGFKGKIITDCITMKALKGSFESRAKAALNAGCDYVLHCSGEMEEMIDAIKAFDK
jgi:beta-glucosidase-like glycosyl hydrolase